MIKKSLDELTSREKDIIRISQETGLEFMASRWQYVNSRIISELPGATVNEGVSLQFNAGIQDIAGLIIHIIDYGVAHTIDFGAPQQLIDIITKQLTDIVDNTFQERKKVMS